MAFKTISLDLPAYRALKGAKKSKSESFSAVIRRTFESPPAKDFSDLLKQLEQLSGKSIFTVADRAQIRARSSLRSRSRRKTVARDAA